MTEVDTCGGRTRAGTPCGRPKGWGTDHPGFGKCKLHGGSTQNGTKAAQNEQAIAVGRRYAAEVDISPEAAILSSVRFARGMRDAFAEQLKDAKEEDIDRLWLRLASANRQLNQNAKAALDADVAARQVRYVEKMGAVVSAIVEAMLGTLRETLGDEVYGPKLRSALISVALLRVEAFEGEDLDGTAELVERTAA